MTDTKHVVHEVVEVTRAVEPGTWDSEDKKSSLMIRLLPAMAVEAVEAVSITLAASTPSLLPFVSQYCFTLHHLTYLIVFRWN